MDLPLEIEETILSYLSAEEMRNIIEVSPAYNSILSSFSFWKERFLRENLPLFFLSPGSTTFNYLNVYLRTIKTNKAVKEYIRKMRFFPYCLRVAIINLSSKTTPSILTVPEVDEEIIKCYFSQALEMENIDNILRDLSTRLENLKVIDDNSKICKERLIDLWYDSVQPWGEDGSIYLELEYYLNDKKEKEIMYKISSGEIEEEVGYKVKISPESLEELLFRFQYINL